MPDIVTPWHSSTRPDGRVLIMDADDNIIGCMENHYHAADAITSHNCLIEQAMKPEPPPEQHVLQEAEDIIHGQRRKDYGTPKESFDRVWALWYPIINSALPGTEKVAMCLLQLKVARYMNSQDRDSVVDIAGYAGCIAQIRGWED